MKTLLITLIAMALASPVLAVDIPPEPGSRFSPDPPQAQQKRNVFGAPIQPPIVHKRTARKKTAPSHASKSHAPGRPSRAA